VCVQTTVIPAIVIIYDSKYDREKSLVSPDNMSHLETLQLCSIHTVEETGI
jgi:hypothetical protein